MILMFLIKKDNPVVVQYTTRYSEDAIRYFKENDIGGRDTGHQQYVVTPINHDEVAKCFLKCSWTKNRLIFEKEKTNGFIKEGHVTVI